jgi:hypothetical protein
MLRLFALALVCCLSPAAPYILILTLALGSLADPIHPKYTAIAVTSAEFSSQASCNAARDDYRKFVDGRSDVFVDIRCVQK